MVIAIISGLTVVAIAAAAKVIWGRARSIRGRMSERIELLPPPGLGLSEGYRYSLLMVREGTDELKESSPLLNRTVPFAEVRGQGCLVAHVHYRGRIGLQFKCFFDAPDHELCLDGVEEAIRSTAWVKPRPDSRVAGRFWFLLDGYPVCTTIDGWTNNFLTFAPQKT